MSDNFKSLSDNLNDKNLENVSNFFRSGPARTLCYKCFVLIFVIRCLFRMAPKPSPFRELVEKRCRKIYENSPDHHQLAKMEFNVLIIYHRKIYPEAVEVSQSQGTNFGEIKNSDGISKFAEIAGCKLYATIGNVFKE